jgi:predicted chitinase
MIDISSSTKLKHLTPAALKEIQATLNRIGFNAGAEDGLFVVRTLDAWADFKASVYLDDPANLDAIGASSYKALIDVANSYKAKVHDFSIKAGVIAAIRWECDKQGLSLPSQKAYAIATTEHETAGSFQPVREGYYLGGKAAAFQRSLTYYPYYGRGFVQLTWKRNYQIYSDILGIDLVSDPDKALNPNVALFVLVHGLKNGTFTGKRLGDFVKEGRTDFVNARRVINGLDRALDIAEIAKRYA